MDVFESDFQYYSNSTLSEISDKNPTYPTLFVFAKVKYPYKTSKIYLYYYILITNDVNFNIVSKIIIYI
jgi:hypothetical protein